MSASGDTGRGPALSGLAPIERMIGYASTGRQFESAYAFVCRIIHANQLNEAEARATLPESMVRAAFGADRQGLEGAMQWLVEHGADETTTPSRVDARVWEPLPGFNSIAPEHLRVCTKCLELQFHTWAWSSDTVAECPVHRVALTEKCPKCGVTLLPKGPSLKKSAFQCPRGCALSGDPFRGLGGIANEPGARWLAQQWAWVAAIQDALAIKAGLAHVAYPPYLAVASLRTPPLPSRGLTTAVLYAMHQAGAAVPPPLAWQTTDPGAWQVSVTPWHARSGGVSEERLEHARRSIRRTAYVTHLPLLDQSAFRRWFDATPDVHPWIDLEKLVMLSGDVVCIPVPSHLVIGNEVRALRQLLARHSPVDIAASIYQDVLFEVLLNAVDRRLQLDLRRPTAEPLWTAERADAVLEARGQMWRVAARSVAKPEASAAWADYQEPAELGVGYVYVSDRRRRL